MKTYSEQKIKVEKQEAILYFLRQLAAKHKDPQLGTYDYDGIATEVLSYVDEKKQK